MQPEAESVPSSRAANTEIYGLAAWFDTPAQLYHACEALRDAGFQRFDAHTPFPVHGLEKAMGIRPTRFAWLVLGGGVTGLSFAVALAYYTQVIDYPLNIGGKQAWSYQAFVPIFFELTILFAALTCFFGVWAVNGLPRFATRPSLTHPSTARPTTCSSSASRRRIRASTATARDRCSRSSARMRSRSSRHETRLGSPGARPRGGRLPRSGERGSAGDRSL